jgi:hypothetical protein
MSGSIRPSRPAWAIYLYSNENILRQSQSVGSAVGINPSAPGDVCVRRSDRQFSFTNPLPFRQPDDVRWFVAFCLFLLVRPEVFSQDQEHKLVDRLIRPNTELQNEAQNKKFLADRKSINKQATIGTFYVQKKSNSKEFAGTRDFSSWQFNAQSFHGDERQANTLSRNQIVNSHTSYATRSTIGVGAANDANKIAAGRTFAGKRPFLDKGKSQKALSAHNKPLTIEEVRELLNKNK